MKPIEFEIPMLPPSINEITGINYHSKKCYTKEKARKFKYQAKLCIPRLSYTKGTKLIVDVRYYGNWHNKNGTIKRRDGQNLDKCLYDAIFDKLGVDDKVAFKGSWEKFQSDTDRTWVKISKY